MKHILLILGLSAGAVMGQGTTNFTVNVNGAVPGGNPSGLMETFNVSGLSGVISDVDVNLDITGGFNGDLYAYLVSPDGGFTVLLNRVGMSSGNSLGYGDAGMDVTLSDAAANGNIHDYQSVDNPDGAQLTGTWAPDGRDIDPQSAPADFDSAPTTADLSVLNAGPADGTWTLFIANLSAGDQTTLVNWGLDITTVPAPEPAAPALAEMGLTGVLLVVLFRRRNVAAVV